MHYKELEKIVLHSKRNQGHTGWFYFMRFQHLTRHEKAIFGGCSSILAHLIRKMASWLKQHLFERYAGSTYSLSQGICKDLEFHSPKLTSWGWIRGTICASCYFGTGWELWSWQQAFQSKCMDFHGFSNEKKVPLLESGVSYTSLCCEPLPKQTTAQKATCFRTVW